MFSLPWVHMLINATAKNLSTSKKESEKGPNTTSFERDGPWVQGVEALCETSSHPWAGEEVWPKDRPFMNHVQYNRQIKRRARINQLSKDILAGWIFHRIPIKRPDKFLHAPTVTGTKIKDGISFDEGVDRVWKVHEDHYTWALRWATMRTDESLFSTNGDCIGSLPEGWYPLDRALLRCLFCSNYSEERVWHCSFRALLSLGIHDVHAKTLRAF